MSKEIDNLLQEYKQLVEIETSREIEDDIFLSESESLKKKAREIFQELIYEIIYSRDFHFSTYEKEMQELLDDGNLNLYQGFSFSKNTEFIFLPIYKIAYMVVGKDKDFLNFLIKNKIDINYSANSLEEMRGDVERKDSYDDIPSLDEAPSMTQKISVLEFAIQEGDKEFIKFLVEHGAKPTLENFRKIYSGDIFLLLLDHIDIEKNGEYLFIFVINNVYSSPQFDNIIEKIFEKGVKLTPELISIAFSKDIKDESKKSIVFYYISNLEKQGMDIEDIDSIDALNDEIKYVIDLCIQNDFYEVFELLKIKKIGSYYMQNILNSVFEKDDVNFLEFMFEHFEDDIKFLEKAIFFRLILSYGSEKIFKFLKQKDIKPIFETPAQEREYVEESKDRDRYQYEEEEEPEEDEMEKIFREEGLKLPKPVLTRQTNADTIRYDYEETEREIDEEYEHEDEAKEEDEYELLSWRHDIEDSDNENEYKYQLYKYSKELIIKYIHSGKKTLYIDDLIDKYNVKNIKDKNLDILTSYIKDYGLDINFPSDRYYDLVELCVMNDNFELCSLLLSLDLKPINDIKNNVKITKKLLNKSKLNLLKLLIDKGFKIKRMKYYFMLSYNEQMRFFIDNNLLDVNRVFMYDEKLYTPVTWILNDSNSYKYERLEIILSYKPNLNIIVGDETPLSICLRERNIRILKLILESGAKTLPDLSNPIEYYTGLIDINYLFTTFTTQEDIVKKAEQEKGQINFTSNDIQGFIYSYRYFVDKKSIEINNTLSILKELADKKYGFLENNKTDYDWVLIFSEILQSSKRKNESISEKYILEKILNKETELTAQSDKEMNKKLEEEEKRLSQEMEQMKTDFEQLFMWGFSVEDYISDRKEELEQNIKSLNEDLEETKLKTTDLREKEDEFGISEDEEHELELLEERLGDIPTKINKLEEEKKFLERYEGEVKEEDYPKEIVDIAKLYELDKYINKEYPSVKMEFIKLKRKNPSLSNPTQILEEKSKLVLKAIEDIKTRKYNSIKESLENSKPRYYNFVSDFEELEGENNMEKIENWLSEDTDNLILRENKTLYFLKYSAIRDVLKDDFAIMFECKNVDKNSWNKPDGVYDDISYLNMRRISLSDGLLPVEELYKINPQISRIYDLVETDKKIVSTVSRILRESEYALRIVQHLNVSLVSASHCQGGITQSVYSLLLPTDKLEKDLSESDEKNSSEIKSVFDKFVKDDEDREIEVEVVEESKESKEVEVKENTETPKLKRSIANQGLSSTPLTMSSNRRFRQPSFDTPVSESSIERTAQRRRRAREFIDEDEMEQLGISIRRRRLNLDEEDDEEDE